MPQESRHDLRFSPKDEALRADVSTLGALSKTNTEEENQLLN